MTYEADAYPPNIFVRPPTLFPDAEPFVPTLVEDTRDTRDPRELWGKVLILKHKGLSTLEAADLVVGAP